MAPLVALLTLLPLLTQAFNLNTSGPDWDYTTSDLANTTSQACKDAYSAEIDCDDTLLGLVASMRPDFKPTSDDLGKTCTTTCSSSLEAYIKNVKAACAAPGDLAEQSLGGSCNPCKFTTQPVELIGQIFQYTLAKDCAKETNGTYCYLGGYSNVSPDFSCSDSCPVAFYGTAHEYPASGWDFNYYSLVTTSSWWIEEFQKGWSTLEQCDGLSSQYSPSPSATSSASETAGPTAV